MFVCILWETKQEKTDFKADPLLNQGISLQAVITIYLQNYNFIAASGASFQSNYN